MNLTGRTLSALDLVAFARDNPRAPVIKGLVYERDVVLLHAPEECFKSVLVMQMAHALAAGRPVLRAFDVPSPLRVGILNTELHPTALGERLSRLNIDAEDAKRMLVLGDAGMKDFRNAPGLKARVDLIGKWAADEGVDVLMCDTANDFFRAPESPDKEIYVAPFFEQIRSSALKSCLLVRHDRKGRADDLMSSNENDQIRGSAEWKEDPEVILSLRRVDKRTHEVVLDVGKLRYGRKPDEMQLWFDAVGGILTPLPPVIACLENGPMSRQQLLEACRERFNSSQRKTDTDVKALVRFVDERQVGHRKMFELRWDAIGSLDEDADEPLRGGDKWRRYLISPGGTVGDLQGCISSNLFPDHAQPLLSEARPEQPIVSS